MGVSGFCKICFSCLNCTSLIGSGFSGVLDQIENQQPVDKGPIGIFNKKPPKHRVMVVLRRMLVTKRSCYNITIFPL